MNRMFSTILCCLAWGLGHGPLRALEFSLEGEFATDFISSSPVRSICVSPAEDIYLMSFADGSIFEVTRDLQGVRQILPPKEPPTEWNHVGYYGIALIPSLGGFVSLPDVPSNYMEFYTRSGNLWRRSVPFGHGHFAAIYFEERQPIGVLHTVHGLEIREWNLTFGGWQLGVGDTILSAHSPGWPPPPLDRVHEQSIIGGIVYIAAEDFHLLTYRNGYIIAVRKGERAGAGPSFWSGYPVAVTDVRPLGIQSIADLGWDPAQALFYVVDSEQSTVFVLGLAPGPLFHRGDPDGSGRVDVGDAVSLLSFLFLGAQTPGCLESADVNNDGLLDVTDAVFLLQYLFHGRESPPAPGPPGHPCGPEPDLWDSQIGLGCGAYPTCR